MSFSACVGKRRSGTGALSVVRRAAASAALLVLLGGGWLVPPEVAAAGEAVVATDVLNVRLEPWLGAEILDQIVWAETVWVLDGPTESNWYYVNYWGERTGWVFGDYLSIGGIGGYAWEAPSSGDAGLRNTAWVDADALNVRAAASVNADSIDLVYGGDALTVIGYESNGYVPISHWSGNAWVLAGSLRWDGSSGSERWIDVDRSSSRVNLYEGEALVASYWGAMGMDQSDDGFYATASGTYYVFAKERGLTWTDWGQVYITDWVAFDPMRHNGFHSYSRDENGKVLENGADPTGGCVALDPAAAQHVFDFARLGTRVEVHW